MSKMFSWAFALLLKVVTWFSVMENRRKVYMFLTALGPLLFLAGFVTPEGWDKWLQAISPILLFGGAGLAARNSKES